MKHIVLVGEGGVGKTTTAKKLIKDLKSKIVISGECPKKSNPYDLFYNMLDSFFEIDLFNKRESNELIDQVLEMAGSVMLGPIAGFMSGKNDMSISKQDIFIAIKNKFLEFKEAVVVIDDIQWIDDASKELLKFLFEELKNSDLFFIITSREKEILNELDLENIFELKGLDKIQQFEFLKNNFYLSDEVAEWIINWIDEENATPLELVNVVSSLYRKNYLLKTEYGYVFSEEFNPNLPSVPDNIKEDIKEIFESMPEYKEIFSLAAIIGKEFDVSVLAKALDMSVIKITTLLYEISKKTNLVYDVLNKDNIFSFKSQIVVDAIKELISYKDKSFLEATAPQIIRFYNQIIAEAMEENNYSDIQIANFYYGASKNVLHKNFEYQLKAARACKNIFEFEKADKYIAHATTLLQLVDKKEEVEELKLLIEADKQFVRGNINLDFTNILIAKTTKNSSDELKIATTRAAYNSGRFDRKYFAKCYELAENYLISSENRYTKAEGYHFAALSLDNTSGNKEKKHKYFTEALKLTKDNKPLYSQIANSYAGFLSFGEQHEKLLAKDLFIKSIEIKENLPVKDLPGLARAYGGLGRLYLFWNPCNCEKAIKYFEKDLGISKELKDEFGISNMYSLLGMAYRLKGDCKKANEYYEKSLELKHNPIDIFASIFGKIACGSNEYERAKEYIKEFGEPSAFTYSFLNDKDKDKLGLK